MGELTKIGYDQIIDKIVNREIEPPKGMNCFVLNAWLQWYADCQNAIIDIVEKLRDQYGRWNERIVFIATYLHEIYCFHVSIDSHKECNKRDDPPCESRGPWLSVTGGMDHGRLLGDGLVCQIK